MTQQQFCLKWNNYQTNMSDVFQSMLMNENLVDVTLTCAPEGTQLSAHKMVLAACSPFFQALFINNPCQHPIIILKDVRFIDLKAIIDFMYRGEVNVSQEQLSALLKTAETLKVKGLAEVTEKQARGQPQLQHALFGALPQPATSTPAPPAPSRKKRRRTKKGNQAHKESGESSESDEENLAPKRHTERRLVGQRTIIQNQVLDKEPNAVPEQMEPSRILEQSMATAEVGGTENGQENILVAQDVSALGDEESLRQHVLSFDESMLATQGDGTLLTLPGTSGSASQATIIVFGQGAGASTASNAIAKVNRVVVGKFECDNCHLKFASNYNLKRHMRIHDQERPRWQCEYCEKSFTRRDSLPKHVNFVHKDQTQNSKDGISITPTSPGSEPT